MENREKFLKDIKQIYPEGNLDNAFTLLKEIIQQKHLDSSGLLVDYEYIINKFRDFHQSWSLKYGKQLAKGYLSKEAESARKNIYEFLLQASYLREYETTLVNVERDKYLFNDHSDKLYDGIKRIEQELFTK